MTRIAFVDTETTGLSLEDDIWEFAAIIREPDGSEHQHHMFIEHDTQRCSTLPPQFLADHQRRFPISGDTRWHPGVWSRQDAAEEIADLLGKGTHIVGAVPNFDTERIAILLRRFGFAPGWHHHLIDVEALAVGYLHGIPGERPPFPHERLPWASDTLSRAVGVDPDDFDRHTALGDAQWARAIYDAVTGPRRAEEDS